MLHLFTKIVSPTFKQPGGTYYLPYPRSWTKVPLVLLRKLLLSGKQRNTMKKGGVEKRSIQIENIRMSWASNEYWNLLWNKNMGSFKFFFLLSSFIPPWSLPAPQEYGMEFKIPYGDLLPSLEEDFYQDLFTRNFI